MSDIINRLSTIGLKIKKLRQEQGINQAELARRAGVTPSAVSQIEAGKRVPTLLVAQKLSGALRCRIEELTGAANRETSNNGDATSLRDFYERFEVFGSLRHDDQERLIDIARRLVPERDADSE